MLFKQPLLARIAAGELTLAFRRWRRPTVRAGGFLRTPVGVLAIDAVDRIEPSEITDADARLAGHPHRAAVLEELARRSDGDVYRIAFHLSGPDSRRALRADAALSTGDVDAIRTRLERLDRASRSGPWTAEALRLIAARPGTRAADLAGSMRVDTPVFKRNVRKLKELGLTESLEVGYRLSPRGRALLDRLD